ncbi:unnamed protein product [Acanthoscelides obtectus]|uniref:Uncharacterized protein n=1 Tax=Acanthoscelides obtectus TaxID=200917 RepID=A0A9P0JPC9_ACAOB|nr:unnamed protein product [Acanthoscelides obtectus]CAK1667944.1 hypothetical protein AOBTE_LOCUS26129 [Acanthoscelides obtectus]
MERWAATTGFRFSSDKTKYLIFSKSRRTSDNIVLSLNSTRFQKVDSIVFLGMTLDSKLKWDLHITKLISSCQKRLNLIKVLANTFWGSDFLSLMGVYRAILRSKIDYDSICYTTASKNSLKKLDVLQHKAIRLAYGLLRTSPVESIHVVANEPPLPLRREYVALRYAAKISSLPDNPAHHITVKCSSRGLYSNYRDCPISERIIRTDFNLNNLQNTYSYSLYSPPWTMRLTDINTSLNCYTKRETNHIVIQNKYREVIEHYKNHMFIFTDASKSRNGVGCAAIQENNKKTAYLPYHSSIFTGELTAINQWNNSTTKLREAISSVTEHLSLPRRRRDQVIISRLLIGHTLVTHKYLFSNQEAPTCQTCQLPDCRLTVKHILLECTATQDARNHACMPESIKEALTTYYERTLPFLKESKWCEITFVKPLDGRADEERCFSCSGK